VVERCIVDKIAVIGQNARVGEIQAVGDVGLTLIGKGAHIPDGFQVGRNCIVGTDADEKDFAEFPDRIIPAGTQIGFQERD